MTHVVFVCETCQLGDAPPQGAAFASALRARLAGEGIEVRTVACMNLCDEPLSLALRAPGKSAYLFAGLNPATDIEDAAALARLYRDAEGPDITDARRAGRLRFCLKGRVPPL